MGRTKRERENWFGSQFNCDLRHRSGICFVCLSYFGQLKFVRYIRNINIACNRCDIFCFGGGWLVFCIHYEHIANIIIFEINMTHANTRNNNNAIKTEKRVHERDRKIVKDPWIYRYYSIGLTARAIFCLLAFGSFISYLDLAQACTASRERKKRQMIAVHIINQ